MVEAIYCGDPADGEELVAPLREFGAFGMDSMAVQPPVGIVDLHMDPLEPVPYQADSMLTGELPAAAIDALVEAIGPGSGSQLLLAELRHSGGAVSRSPQDAGALATLPGSFLAFGGGFVPVPDAMGTHPCLARRLKSRPRAVRRRYVPQLCGGALGNDQGVPTGDGGPAARGQAPLRP